MKLGNMEEIVTSRTTCPKGSSSSSSSERKVRPQKEQALNCPRCNSTNTKFCYYNNYSLTQPRYFCKTCRRYWTEGGSLRNIPVGGGSRKNKRSSSSSSSSSLSSLSHHNPPSKKLPDLVPLSQNPNPKPQDLNLGFSMHHHHEMIQPPSSSSSSPHHLSPLELLTGFTASRGSNSFDPYSSGFTNLPDFKPSLDFSLDGLGSNYATFQGVQQANGKLLFPFQDLKQVSSNDGNGNGDDQHNRQDHNSNGSYWNGVIGGGGSW